MAVGVRIGLIFLMFLVLGAHFLRMGTMFLTGLCVAFPVLIFVRSWWAKIVLQIGLGGATIVWILTTMYLIMERQQRGAPWTRMAIILGAVALANLGVAALMQGSAMRRWFYPADDAAG